jgi:hypothetical protein
MRGLTLYPTAISLRCLAALIMYQNGAFRFTAVTNAKSISQCLRLTVVWLAMSSPAT